MATSRSRLLLATASSLMFPGLLAAQAQTTSERQVKGVEEVTVTAQKRSTALSKTPVAMSALSGVQLKQKSVTNIDQLAATTPSFSVGQEGPTSGVNIRGIGLAVSSPNVASGVPIYRDGLFTTTLLPSEPFYDIADVEVLRGPQGTLVGTNSTGGALFINSQSPKLGPLSGYAEVKAGSYRDIGVDGAVNLPISDTLAARVAFNWETRDSFWTNEANNSSTDNHPGNLNQKDVRVGVLWQPNAAFSLLVKTNYQDDDNDGLAHTPLPGYPASYSYPTEPFHLNYADGNTFYRDYQTRTSVEAKYVFPDGITLRSLSGFTYTHEFYNDEDYTSTSTTTAVSTPLINHIEDHLFTQEFNVLSPAGDRFHYVFGSYSQFWPAKIKLTAPTTAAVTLNDGTDKVANGLFGEVGYDLTPKLEFHVGARYTFNHTYSYGATYLTLPGQTLTIGSNNDSETDGLFTGRVGVDYKLSPTQFLYVVVAKGAKTGGINGVGIPNFAPESVYNFEGGVKSTLLNGQLRTQLDGFYMDYQRLQLATTSPTVGTAPMQSITNAGSATIAGGEASAQAHFGNLGVDTNIAYVHSSISAGELLNTYLYTIKGLSPTGLQCALGQVTNCFDYTPYYQNASGVPNPYSPTWTFNIGAQYNFFLPNGDSLTPRVDFSYTSPQIVTVFDNPGDKFQSRKLLNLHLTYTHGPWSVTGYGTNITNEYYIVGQTNNADLYGNPAEYGVRLSRTF